MWEVDSKKDKCLPQVSFRKDLNEPTVIFIRCLGQKQKHDWLFQGPDKPVWLKLRDGGQSGTEEADKGLDHKGLISLHGRTDFTRCKSPLREFLNRKFI